MTDDLFDAESHAAEHARFAFDDAAYVLGALEPADRDAFEAHLSGCPICQAQVSELSGLDSLLARAPQDRWDEEPLPGSLLPRLLLQVGGQRRRRRLRTALLGAVAACLLVALSLTGAQFVRSNSQPAARAFTPVLAGAQNVHAAVRIVASGSGTSLHVTCGHYAGAGGLQPSRYPGSTASPAPAAVYRLVVVNRSGAEEIPTSWSPDRDIAVDTGTDWPRSAIARIEIQDGTGSTVLRVVL